MSEFSSIDYSYLINKIDDWIRGNRVIVVNQEKTMCFFFYYYLFQLYMYLYIIGTIIAIYVLFFGIFRLKHPLWKYWLNS